MKVVEFHEMKVPLNWTDGAEMTILEWGQREYDSGHKCGVRNGIAAACKYLNQKAAECFLGRAEDGKAIMLRSLADEIEKAFK